MYINNCCNNNVLRTTVTHDVDGALSHAMPIRRSINIFNTEFGNIYDKYISTTTVTITCCALLSHMMLMHHCHMPCRYGEVLIYLILSSAIFMTNIYQQLP